MRLWRRRLSFGRRCNRLATLSLVAIVHVLFVALLLFGLMQSRSGTPDQQLQVVLLGGPLGAPRIVPPKAPVFVEPDLQDVVAPTIDDSEAPVSSVPSGNLDVTTPAEAIAEQHAFPDRPAASTMAADAMVRLLLSVSETGEVTDAKVVESSGVKSLDELAISWVKERWKYRPARKQGTAVAVTTLALVRFIDTAPMPR